MSEEGLDRILVIDSVYFCPYNDEVIGVDSRYDRPLETQEQVYTRQCHNPNTVSTEEWRQLDFGWLSSNIGMFVITNDEGKYYDTHPSEEEKEDTKKRILQIRCNANPDCVWLIPPGESFRGSPSDPSHLWIRCEHGQAKYTLTAFPR